MKKRTNKNSGKSPTGAPAPGDNAFLSLVPSMAADVSVNRDDLLAIYISKYEAQLENQLKKIQEDLKTNRFDREKQSKRLNEAVLLYGQQQFGPKLEQIKEAISDFSGLPLEVRVSILAMPTLKEESGKFHVSAPGRYRQGMYENEIVDGDSMPISQKLQYSVAMYEPSSKNRDSYPVWKDEKKLDTPPNVKEILERIKTLNETQSDLESKGLEVRQNLAKIGTKERQARGLLAQTLLSQSEEGRALMAKMEEMGAANPLLEVNAVKVL